MKMKHGVHSFLAFFLSFYPFYGATRSVHRPLDPTLPEVSARWENKQRKYISRDSHWEESPTFSFKESHFFKHLLPEGPITYRTNPDEQVDGKILSEKIEHLLKELRHKKRKNFTDFIVLQKKNFSFRQLCGLLVLKFKDYPFVVKLFMEKPKTFINRYGRGFEPVFFFYMSGGTNRHINGLTRIKNRNYILKNIQHYPQWKDRVDIPRKWFWQPAQSQWMVLEGKNMKTPGGVSVRIPGTYAIVADAIDTTQKMPISPTEQSRIAIALCRDLNFYIDAHYGNFVFSAAPNEQEPLITIIDTEHFPSMVGLKDPVILNSYLEWYAFLTQKFACDCYLQTKRDRRKAHYQANRLALWHKENNATR